MRNEIVTLALVAILTSLTPPAQAQSSSQIAVSGDRILLGDVVPSAPTAVSYLDLGPSPLPGRRRTLSRQQIKRRLRVAGLGGKRMRVPLSVTILRPAQRVSEPRLKRMLRRALEMTLPSNLRVQRLLVGGSVTLPQGHIHVSVETPQAPSPGRRSLRATLRVGGSRALVLPITVDLVIEGAAKDAVHIVKRGDRVMILARAQGLTVRTRGVVQKAGAKGDLVPVIPSLGSRVLMARVRSSSWVEIDL